MTDFKYDAFISNGFADKDWVGKEAHLSLRCLRLKRVGCSERGWREVVLHHVRGTSRLAACDSPPYDLKAANDEAVRRLEKLQR